MWQRVLVGTLAVLLLPSGINAQRATAQGSLPAIPAVALDARSAILDAFRVHQFVALGDAHGNVLGEAFQLALVRDPRFAAAVQDILVESGNSRYQDLVDRFVRGEDVAPDALQRVWLDTTQQQVASMQVPELFTTVRSLNASLAPERQLRILLGEPPIDWSSLQTADELRKWEAEPLSDRDQFALELVRREVFAKNRRVLALYGAGHFFRKVIRQSLVTLLEGGGTKAFTIWTNATADMAAMQADVASWPVPSLAHLQGTVLGQKGIEEYFGPSGKTIPQQWRAPMQEQFDAVLYLGPLSSITLARPQPWPCSAPAFPERLRRLRLQRAELAERIKQQCVQ